MRDRKDYQKVDNNKQSRLIAVFEDTQKYYAENPTLAEAVKKSREHTAFHPAEDYPELPEPKGEGKVSVTKSKTFQAAIEQNRRHPGKRIAVLNFASPTNPGRRREAGVERARGKPLPLLDPVSDHRPPLAVG
jgi:hypothetical protein